MENRTDIPIFTFSHECRLLTECYPFMLPDGKMMEMKSCARGEKCVGMYPNLEGHKESGGIILRGLLTPEEMTSFENTGKNPEGDRLCVLLCSELYG